MNKIYIKIIIFICSIVLLNFSNEIPLEIKCRGNVLNLDTNLIVTTIIRTLDLNSVTFPIYNVSATIRGNNRGCIDHIVVYVYQANAWKFWCYRLNFNNGKVKNVISDYDEPNESINQPCATCPDPEVEAIFSTSITSEACTKKFVADAMQSAKNAGIKAKSLLGNEESLTNIRNYLTCPKLKIWGRVGHGNQNGIVLAKEEKFNSAEVESQSKYIKGKIFAFNSCTCHVAPFEPAMIKAGAYFFVGGDKSLPVDWSEKVTSSFIDQAIAKKAELEKALKDGQSTQGLYGYFGHSSATKGPWYYDKATIVLNPKNININSACNEPCFQMHLNKIVLTNKTTIPISYQLYSLSGQCIENDILPPSNEWYMTGNIFTSGNYLIVYKIGERLFKKKVFLVK